MENLNRNITPQEELDFIQGAKKIISNDNPLVTALTFAFANGLLAQEHLQPKCPPPDQPNKTA